MKYRLSKSLFLSILLAVATATFGQTTPKVTTAPKPLTDAELADGWISLFDGETLFGWKAASKADWQVQDGAIRVTGGEKGLLCTTVEFDNYVLKADFRAAKNINSGIFLRTSPVVGMNDITTKCYELNIAPPDNPFPTGSFVGRQKGKSVPERDGQWQSYEVTVNGDKSTVKLNGETVLEYTDPKPSGRGFIGLQLNEGQVEFKNIKLKPLGLDPLFNGKDLSGWKNHPESKSTFTVTDKGEIHVTSTGRGVLESEKQFGDFILQMEAISHAPELNSGLFIRSIPGEFANGYESQIHNGIKDGDRRQPKDFGTGGIYRRVPARLVIPKDKEWFYKTIVADGPHISVWVNGYQVTDWTDDRKPDKNPRNGLRTEAGTLQLQGHDPTTNLSFRNIRARELAGQKTWNFDNDQRGQLPRGFKGEVGQWEVVESDQGQALAQSAKNDNAVFNLALLPEVMAKDVDLAVKMKAIAGDKDQGGGLVWRAQDAKNYYLARYNPLEDNYRLYHVIAGKRTQLGTAENVAHSSGWHTLRVTMKSDHIACFYDDHQYLDLRDNTIAKSGHIGLWTKSDAQSQFDDLSLATN